MKNKRGQVIFFLLSIGVVFFILGLALTPALKEITDEVMGESQMNCSDPNLTDQQKANCTGTDMLQFIYSGTIFGLAGLLIGAIALR